MSPPDFLLPFGPFHMVLLHLPIGVLIAIWFIELLPPYRGDLRKNQALLVLHSLLFIGTLLTVFLGLAYAIYGDYGSEIDGHKYWGYGFAAAVGLTYVLYLLRRISERLVPQFVYYLGLLASTITMVITGHIGGELIHGKGFLTKAFEPEPIHIITGTDAPQQPAAPIDETPAPPKAVDKVPQRAVEPTPKTATLPKPHTPEPEPGMELEPIAKTTMASAIETPSSPAAPADPRLASFEKAHAVFKAHCFNCHGATKQKGKYRMDNALAIMTPGKSKLPPIVPGELEQSELIHRIRLPRHDDDAMPPSEKAAVPTEGIQAIEAWVAAGAYWPKPGERKKYSEPYVELTDADSAKLIEQISTTGAKAEYNAWNDLRVRIDLGVVEPGQLETALEQLPKFGDKLIWLDASNLELPQSFFQQLPKFQNLERLHLDGSNVSDSDLSLIAELPKLTYLNLYNTAISDAGLKEIHNNPHLKRLYLSNTKVSQSGIRQLAENQPELTIIHR